MRRITVWALALPALFLAASTATADNLSGAQSLLCTSIEATICSEDSECVTESPEELNIPEFLELDLKNKMMSTTKASGENRSTPMRTLEKENGLDLHPGHRAGPSLQSGHRREHRHAVGRRGEGRQGGLALRRVHAAL